MAQRLLEDEIHQFLLNTARWSSAWFSKPKFHILVHLPQHIARFGPAILFATEAFESFNAVIRAKSVHSNRQAPSRDIALSFAQGNRLRHWLGGGAIRNLTSDSVVVHNKTRTLRRAAFSKDKDDWSTVGPGPQLITKPPAVVSSYLGLGRSGSTTRKPSLQPKSELGAYLCLHTSQMCARQIASSLLRLAAFA